MTKLWNRLSTRGLKGILAAIIVLLLFGGVYLFYFPKKNSTTKVQTATNSALLQEKAKTHDIYGQVTKIKKDSSSVTITLRADSLKDYQITLDSGTKITKYVGSTSSKVDYKQITVGSRLHLTSNLDLSKTFTIGSSDIFALDIYVVSTPSPTKSKK